MTQFNFHSTGKNVISTFPERVQGKTVLITGPSQGSIGAETAITIAGGQPNLLLLLGRSEAKIVPVVENMKEIYPDVKVQFIECDLSSLDSVRNAAEVINNQVDRIHYIVNNAGIMACPYQLTIDRIEMQFATNHLGHFLLTNLLLPKILAAGPGARIVNVSSRGHRFSGVRTTDWNFEKEGSYTPWDAYSQSKTSNILYAAALARKLEKHGIQAYSINPGSVLTNLQYYAKQNPDQFLGAISKLIEIEAQRGHTFERETVKSLEQGCMTTLVAMLDPSIEPESGAFLEDGNVSLVQLPDYAKGVNNEEALWSLSENLVGQRFEL